MAGGHVLPISVPIFPWPLPHVSASSPLLIRTVVFGFRVTIPDDQSSDCPFCIPGSRVGAKVPTACSQPPLSQPGPGLGHVASSCQGAQWCIRGRMVQEGSQVIRSPHGLPTARCPIFHSAEAPGTCFQGCRETVSYGHWGVHTGRARGFYGWRVRARISWFLLYRRPAPDGSPVPALLTRCRAFSPSSGLSPRLIDHMVLGAPVSGSWLRAAKPHVLL